MIFDHVQAIILHIQIQVKKYKVESEVRVMTRATKITVIAGKKVNIMYRETPPHIIKVIIGGNDCRSSCHSLSMAVDELSI